jgi:dihydrofolate reductase
MGKVVSHMTMSLDGFVADPHDGWDDRHPAGAPVVVVTHRPPQDADSWTTISFADSVESGIAAARQIAGDKDVTIASASIAAQALDLGLVDEVNISLVPVLMGKGIPYFANLAHAPHRFDDPDIVPGSRVTHLRYAVRRTGSRPRPLG